MTYFCDSNKQAMVSEREQLASTLTPVAETIAQDVPSFEGFVLFQQDAYHPDSAGAIAQINAPQVDSSRLAFQNNHVANRRVDLEVSALGETFQNGRYELTESRMNPREHLVAGIHIPESLGHYAASVFQLAFTRDHGEPTSDQLETIHRYWKTVEPECLSHLEILHRHAELFPNRSVADALELDVPTTPNAFIVGWDTSDSRVQTRENYGKLRSDLTLRGQQFTDIVEEFGGNLMRPTGDGQVFELFIPSSEYDRLSDTSIRLFAIRALIPMVQKLREAATTDGRPPVRFTADLGRVEQTTFDHSSPTIFEMADVSDKQPHDHTTVAFGRRIIEALALTESQIDALNT